MAITATKVTALLNAFTRLGNSVSTKLTQIATRLNLYRDEIRALKVVEAKDIGLGDVPNYKPATRLQAEGAVNNTTLMTPKRVTNWAEVNVYEPIGQAFKDATDRLS